MRALPFAHFFFTLAIVAIHSAPETEILPHAPQKAVGPVISVRNGTFGKDTFDVKLAMTIAPPVPLHTVKCYHDNLPNSGSLFYSLNTQSNTTEAVGPLGKKTEHAVHMHEGAIEISLYIQMPFEKDRGDYMCQLFIEGQTKPKIANLYLQQRVPLMHVKGYQLPNAQEWSVCLEMDPTNVTLYWIKCFHRATPDPTAHFFTYDNNLNSSTNTGDIGSRVTYNFVKDEKLKFYLQIRKPIASDEGTFCCQIDADGISQPETVVISLVDRVSIELLSFNGLRTASMKPMMFENHDPMAT